MPVKSQRRFIVVPRNERAMSEGLDLGDKHIDFRGKTATYVRDAGIADAIDQTYGLKGGNGDCWVAQDERFESTLRDTYNEIGTHRYFFGSNDAFRRGWERIFGKKEIKDAV